MYDLALSVTSCLGAGTKVDLAWLVDVQGLDYRRSGEALVLTPGGGRIGSILGGALDGELADAAVGSTGRIIEVPITEFAAVLAGLPTAAPGAAARCVVMPATDLPDGLWPLLRERVPLCLVTELSALPALGGSQTGETTVFTRDTVAAAGDAAARLFERGSTAVEIIDGSLVTVLWPVPRLILVGNGPMVDALEAATRLLDWSTQRITDADDVRRIPDLTAMDGIVVAVHDLDLAGAALAKALSTEAGYIGALGSRAMQRARTAWFADRGIDTGERIHGPAGLDIGARKPGEVAISVLAQMLATRA